MTIIHEEGLITEDHKNNSSRDILIDSNLCMVENPNSDESGSLPFPNVANGSSDSSTCDVAHRALGIDGTLCDISAQVESFDETRAMAVPPNLLIFEPNDIAFSMDESDFFGGLSEKRTIFLKLKCLFHLNLTLMICTLIWRLLSFPRK